MSTRQSPLEGIIDAASKFEESHYKDTDASGSAEPLNKSDFSSASDSVTESISSSATAVKEAVMGKVLQLHQTVVLCRVCLPVVRRLPIWHVLISHAGSQPLALDRRLTALQPRLCTFD